MTIFFLLITPLLASLFSLLVKKQVKVLHLLALFASLIEFFIVGTVVSAVVKHGVYAYQNYFYVDYLGSVLLMILATVGLLVSWYSITYLKTEVAKKIIGFHRVRQYFVLLHLFLLVMFLAVITTSPIIAWVAIEATTLSTAFLISFYNKPSATEAAWKYLIISSVGLLLAFFGTLLFLASTMAVGGHTLVSWQLILTNAASLNPFVAQIAFLFICIGYGTKVGLAPMHTWLPDAHSKAPAPISSLLSGVLLNVAFLIVLRFKLITDVAVGQGFAQGILIFFGVASIVVAALIIYTQKNYKRLLAYSSIEHMGIIALGFGFGGAGAFAGLLHMIYHSLTKPLLFLSAGNIFLKYGSTKIKNIKGIISLMPITGVIFVIGFLAITGVPPFGMFVTEFSILASGIHTHLTVTIVVILALALVFVGFLRHVIAMMFGANENGLTKTAEPTGLIAPIMVLAVLLIGLSFFLPESLSFLISSATLAY
ncbi:MAG: hypothetical protein A2458_04505 [Candidatus Kerfeldbacteria bacterium RIFOXYC2_FULL_38_9]|uniref:NADH:quinone oxidoreductase/Mrp antiporter transmembrane domain-containing protein n=1 Tax=Candidatus Kerfeldbacteria bacterium RIFOXYB2_FULL_38_14 TaxID=1798547 RepID=A0A1G2BFR8_9BACT|nr:MAG: hypothetical protein A2319_02510 [Candidatus Kerfeldbacteria bacterium RIFOXYB2_FULL_38_14]OGY90360.1 MAG: hypothetical protein A2458_04505 [Candidatus Kerfeldbacteria bacterium RIFOXYC2_FULL_38_9]